MNPDEKVTYFAETDFRNERTKFGIKAKDRSRHVYVIGMTGMGKSTMLENLAIQDIQSGEGVGFIDPHGGTAEKLLSYVPEHRINDVVYFAPFDTEYPIAFNVLDNVDPARRHLVVGGLMSAFKKIWVDAFSGRMEYILTMTLLALTEYPNATLLGVNRMYSDKEFRRKVVEHVKDPSVKAFWVEEYAKYDPKFATEATAAIQNKVGQFTGNPLIRNLIGQTQSSFDIRDIMDNRKILIINLSKGRVGEDNANLIGSMMITKMYLAAMSRADVPEHEMRHVPAFNFFVDEFQSFASDSFANILSEARKYKLNLTIAHQYVEQMSDMVRAAVFGNVGTMIAFRVGSTDAEIFEKEFAPFFLLEDIVSLSQRQIYLRLMIDGVGSQPFSAITLPPIPCPEPSFKNQVVDSSRMKYARNKDEVSQHIREWHEPVTLNDQDRERSKQESLVKKPGYGSFGSSGGARQNPQYSGRQENTQSQQITSPKKEFSKPLIHVDVPAQIQTSKPSFSPKVNTEERVTLKQALQNEGLYTEDKSFPSESHTQNNSVSIKNFTNERVSLSALLSPKKQAKNHIDQVKQKATFKAVVNNAQHQPESFGSRFRPYSPVYDPIQQKQVQNHSVAPTAPQVAPLVQTQSTDSVAQNNMQAQVPANNQSKEIPAHILRQLLE